VGKTPLGLILGAGFKVTRSEREGCSVDRKACIP
jgi:hypothetical protein